MARKAKQLVEYLRGKRKKLTRNEIRGTLQTITGKNCHWEHKKPEAKSHNRHRHTLDKARRHWT
jgi:hypothetical protein